MPAGANSRTPATDFVQDYAAKRQAQMERARQLREDRLQQQRPPPPPRSGGGGSASNASPTYTAVPSVSGAGTETVVPTLYQPPPPPLNLPRSRHVTSGHVSADSSSAPGKSGDGCVLYVKEQDFKQATQAGIITPDQARQLWAMLSNQIIRVCSPSAHAHAVSVSSLLALSNHSYNSSGRAVNGPQSAGGSEFGTSISLESLRTSIAYFKREQQRLQQQQQQGGVGAAGSASQDLHPLSSSPPAPSNTAGQPLSQARGLPSRKLKYDGTVNSDYYGEDDAANENPQRPLAVPMPRRGGGGGAGRGGRPSWNSDVEVRHEDNYDDDHKHRAPSPTSTGDSGAVAFKKPRTGRVSMVRPAAKGSTAASSPASAASGLGGTSAQGGVGKGGGGGGYGNDDEEAGNNVYVPPKPSAIVPRGSKSGGSGAAARRPPASRLTAPSLSSGAPVNVDDMPVGGGGGGGMNDWANAYPPGMVPPVLAGGNDAIAAEAAAAEQEPMQECRTCGRRFRVSVILRHEGLCRNQANKPRKVFNMREQRLCGVEGIKEVQRAVARSGGGGGGRGGGGGGGRGGGSDAAAGAAKGKLPKWKVQHEQFQAAMRAVRQQQQAGCGFGTGQLAPPPAPIPEEYDDRVPCPHCGRKFAQEVAARHIPKCATTIAKPKGIRPIRR
ncbi:hypothetical protein, conserved [Leishmania tarentolae]|uniref:C2HC/C3H-type domain-containing protein n=1 Tax=Leishmania tarentolae TaxID=5689 RepID=A0A640KDL0_LEITA|nr:hypothetical protein, conserved [Leishmania tarentolae]